jgi:hypothetical protein
MNQAIGPGDVVVCINDNFHPKAETCFRFLPIKDEQYVVRDVIVHDFIGQPNDVGITLDGFVNPNMHFDYKGLRHTFEANYSITRFRKIQDAPVQEKIHEEAQVEADSFFELNPN